MWRQSQEQRNGQYYQSKRKPQSDSDTGFVPNTSAQPDSHRYSNASPRPDAVPNSFINAKPDPVAHPNADRHGSLRFRGRQ